MGQIQKGDVVELNEVFYLVESVNYATETLELIRNGWVKPYKFELGAFKKVERVGG